MTSSEIRSKFLAFFEKRGHTIISSVSLVTPDEKGVTNSTLFNTAGMQPLIPYLLGKPYITDGQEIKRIVDFQKCIRTVDIDDVGDKTHATFFEMLGNWSLGDYFKEDAIKWSYEFLTDKEEGLGLDPSRLYVTVFEGDENAPRDDEAVEIWQKVFGDIGVGGRTSDGEAGRIFYLPAENNWWQAGDNGPCGPDTEMYYDIGNTFGGKPITRDQFLKADSERQVVEIWNDVFMQYEKKDGKIVGKLPKPSVDTGAGLERLAMTLQEVDNIYDTDLLKPVMDLIKTSSENFNEKSARIVADHLKASIFLIADGVVPNNTGRGYILRRLIRRAIFKIKALSLKSDISDQIIKTFVLKYSDIYTDLNEKLIKDIFKEEESKFLKTLAEGKKEFDRGVDAFTLFSSYGFPLELTLELAREKGISIDTKEFSEKFKTHQDLSRAGAEQKFRGGLADDGDPMVVRYHTATHLLHQALHDVLGENEGNQKGSNITTERLRFDFTGTKLTDEQKNKIEDIVNEKITMGLPMNNVVLPRAEAEKIDARQFFGEKYGDQISVYFIGTSSNPPTIDEIKNAYSKEFCGGPHVKNTSELAGPDGKWKFKIKKEEAVAQGIRRIKAVLE